MRAKYHESDPFASASFETLRPYILESRRGPYGSWFVRIAEGFHGPGLSRSL